MYKVSRVIKTTQFDSGTFAVVNFFVQEEPIARLSLYRDGQSLNIAVEQYFGGFNVGLQCYLNGRIGTNINQPLVSHWLAEFILAEKIL
jgi:hypothetical protein